MSKTALITGVTGQDGSYLAELLLSKGYRVHGLIRRTSMFNTARIRHLFRDPHEQDIPFFLHYGDMLDGAGLSRLIERLQPDEVYNLAAQSHVRVSFDIPTHTADVVAMGASRLLEAVWESGLKPRYYQASASDVFGKPVERPQRETTPLRPRNPYAVSKAFGHWMTGYYREALGLHATCGILFNHESPRRGETFVTRKITRAIANIVSGRQSKLYLGDLDARRDWGYAPEYVDAIWRIVQADVASDFVIATGESHSVRDFLNRCCERADLIPDAVVEIDPRYFRPAESNDLVGDPSRAQRLLGWKAATRFEELVDLMLAADLEAVGIDVARFGLQPVADKAIVFGGEA